MTLLETVSMRDSTDWQAALNAAAKFMPEARKIYLRETGKACNNFATQLLLAKFFISLQEPRHD